MVLLHVCIVTSWKSLNSESRCYNAQGHGTAPCLPLPAFYARTKARVWNRRSCKGRRLQSMSFTKLAKGVGLGLLLFFKKSLKTLFMLKGGSVASVYLSMLVSKSTTKQAWAVPEPLCLCVDPVDPNTSLSAPMLSLLPERFLGLQNHCLWIGPQDLDECHPMNFHPTLVIAFPRQGIHAVFYLEFVSQVLRKGLAHEITKC